MSTLPNACASRATAWRASPTLAPTELQYLKVAASMSLVGLDCDDYGDDESTAVMSAMDSAMTQVRVRLPLCVCI